MLLLISEMLVGESFNQATYMVQEDQVQEDQPWKADVSIVSTEAGKVSSFGGQTASFAFALFKSDQFWPFTFCLYLIHVG